VCFPTRPGSLLCFLPVSRGGGFFGMSCARPAKRSREATGTASSPTTLPGAAPKGAAAPLAAATRRAAQPGGDRQQLASLPPPPAIPGTAQARARGSPRAAEDPADGRSGTASPSDRAARSTSGYRGTPRAGPSSDCLGGGNRFLLAPGSPCGHSSLALILTHRAVEALN
jgi:hypothetical protein